jgi:two-component system, OmpR family, response regulator
MNDARFTSGLRVLVVDDNRDAADTLATLLAMSGYDVQATYSGEEAFKAALADVPDCLIADIAMPWMTGYELAKRVRAEPRLNRTRLVAYTSFTHEEHARLAGEAGFDFRMTKADDTLELLEFLKMMKQLKDLATKTKELAQQNVELVGETRDTLKEVKQDVKEVKKEVRELKQDVKELKEEVRNHKDDPKDPPTAGQ